MPRRALSALAACALFWSGGAQAAPDCHGKGVWLQVLGSGGPELGDRRASSGYLVWRDGHARILVDLGPGSLLNFERGGARVEDLDMVLLTHLHVDHSGDLPGLVKAAFFTGRARDLPVYGPTGNALMPDTSAFVASLFADPQGAWRYLSGYLSGDEAFRVLPRNVPVEGRAVVPVAEGADYRVSAIPVHHGPVPALAWRVDIGGRAIAFSGDMNGDFHTLPALAAGADLLVAHNAVPEGATGAARALHMPPSVIGALAAESGAQRMLLSHRMLRTLGREAETRREVRKRYAGPVSFAEDGACIRVGTAGRD